MKPNTKPLSGMMELLPQEQIEFDRIMNVIKKHHAAFGFSPIDTPIIERTETLLAKAGGETEKQIYKVEKGDHELSLRFDLTVPTARFVSNNLGQLIFPFKRSQIGKVYRGERSQRGRFREFYQCDVDIIGRGELSTNYDAEIIAVIYEIFRELDFGKFTLRINNRNIISGLLNGLNISSRSTEVMALIDRAEKISAEEFAENLSELKLGEKTESVLRKFVQISGKTSEVVQDLKKLSLEFNDCSQFDQGVNELKKVAEILAAMNVNEDYYKLDMLIVRGLDYYTGTVFETILDDFKDIGSISSGGRYDDLCGQYTKESLPGVGGSIGITRLFWTLRELGLLKFTQKTPAEILVIPFSENELNDSLQISAKIRAAGINTETLLDQMQLKKALKYADKKGVKFVIIIGEDEIKSGRYMVKNMASGEETELTSWLDEK